MSKSSPRAETLVVVLGPTASGKSELAIQIARHIHGEIVNFDSIQVYRGFDIGSAKVPADQRHEIPHHLIDVLDPGELFTAGDFARQARRVLSDIAERNRIPILAGGTGFYLRALLHGLSPAPQRDPALRSRLLQREERRAGSLHRLLSRLDPPASARIHPNDHRKLIRAMELCLIRRQPASELWSQDKEALQGFRPIKIGLDPPRAELYERIDIRVAQMFERGLLAEVQAIQASGAPKSAKPFESLGYAQAIAHLEGRLSLNEAVTLAQQATRQYAKRQMTWFRREPGVQWFADFGTRAEVQAAAMEVVKREARPHYWSA